MKETSHFDELLKQISNAHMTEVDTIKKKYESEVNLYKKQTEKLRAELEKLQKQAAGLVRMVRSKSSDSDCDVENENQMQDEHTRAILQDLEAIDLFEDQAEPNFHLLDGWLQSLVGGGSLSKVTQWSDKSPSGASVLRRRNVIDPNGQVGFQGGCVIVPGNTFRLAWDVCGLILISYDLMTIPFNQAFQPPETLFSMTTDWITLLFWTGDMIQGFFLGYYHNGEVIIDNWKIFINYIKTWLIVDAIVVVPEWTMKFLPAAAEGGEVGDLGKIAKFARVARVLRLLRLLKMKKLLETLVDRIESEYSFILFNLVHLLVFVMVLNHVIACLWYLIGRLSMSEGLTNWVDEGNVRGSQISYLYATSLHWSLTQFTPASMDISAKNIWERLFSVTVLLFAMLVFSSIVASITAAMTALRNLQGNEMRQFWLLRRYLRQRDIKQSLSVRIIKFLEYRSAVQGNLVQKDRVPILASISEALQDELQYEMHSPDLTVHPFFSQLKDSMHAVMYRLCRIALNFQPYATDDTVFNAGDESKRMFFVKSGELDYVVLTSGLTIDIRGKPEGDRADWLCEPALFTTWRHRGSLIAITGAELITIEPTQFRNVMFVHPKPWHYAVSYAKAFVNYLNRGTGEDLTDILRSPGMYDEIMENLRPETPSTDEKDATATSPTAVHPTHSPTRISMKSISASFQSDQGRLNAEGGGEDNHSQSYQIRWWTPICRLWLPCQEVLLSRFRG